MTKELVYVPQRATLVNSLKPSNVSATKKIPEPGVFLVVQRERGKFGIFCEGSIWYVDSKDCFKVE